MDEKFGIKFLLRRIKGKKKTKDKHEEYENLI